MLQSGFKQIRQLAGKSLFRQTFAANFCNNHKKDFGDLDDPLSSQKFANHTSKDEDYMRLFDGNKIYRENKIYEDPQYFERLSQGQSPKYLFIGCADSRVPPNELTKTGPGELFIHRNVANLVVPTDFNINSVIQFSVEVLKIKHIIVMGHTQCGGVKAAMDNKHLGMIDQWLSNIREVYTKYEEELRQIEDQGKRMRRLTELNVKEQVLNLCKNQFVQKAWASGQSLAVHGWICEVETGKIIDLQVQEQEWESLPEYFKFDFPGLRK